MINRSDKQTADVLLLASVLEKLRTHDGLTVARLHAGRSGIAAPLMELAATRRFATVHELDLASAAFDLGLGILIDEELQLWPHGPPTEV